MKRNKFLALLVGIPGFLRAGESTSPDNAIQVGMANMKVGDAMIIPRALTEEEVLELYEEVYYKLHLRSWETKNYLTVGRSRSSITGRRGYAVFRAAEVPAEH